MNARPCVTVVIVTYQSVSQIRECLTCLHKTAADWIADVRVVDNASNDGTADLVAKEFPGVALIRNEVNLGFSRGCNLGARGSTASYLLFLNPDTKVESGAVGELAHFMDHREEAGACGPMVIDDDGRFDSSCRRGFPTPGTSLGRLFGLERLFPRSRRFAGYRMEWLPTTLEMTVDCLSGASMLVRRSVFEEIGGFDEDYFLFGDDIDICWRIHAVGREIWYVPAARIVHRKGESMKSNTRQAAHEFYRSMILFIDKRLTDRYSAPMRALMKAGVRLRQAIGSVADTR